MHYSPFFLGVFGVPQMLLVLFVIVLLFGAKRIPELFRGLGEGVREFKDATKDNDPAYRDQPAPPPAQPPYQPPYQQPTNPNDTTRPTQ